MYTENLRWTEQNTLSSTRPTEARDSRHDTRQRRGGNQFSYPLRMPVGQEEMAAACSLRGKLMRKRNR